MGTRTATTTPKACPAIPEPEPVKIPTAEFGDLFDKLMTGQRLLLALHRMEQENRCNGGCIATPGELVAWEAFVAIHSACDELGRLAGCSLEEREPE